MNIDHSPYSQTAVEPNNAEELLEELHTSGIVDNAAIIKTSALAESMPNNTDEHVFKDDTIILEKRYNKMNFIFLIDLIFLLLRRFVREPVLRRGEGLPSHCARRSSHRTLPPTANELEGMFTFCRSTRKRCCQWRLDCV